MMTNKKQRTPLIMENGAEVNTLEELQSNFSITSIMDYLESGELVAWLKSRYYDDIADEVEKLDSCDDDVDEKLYKIFEVDNPETAEKKAEQEKEKAEKLKKLQKFLGDDTYKKYISVIDKIAFTQDDLYDFLDAGENKIYLCGEKFEVPISVQNVTYVGIGEPLVVIRLKGISNLEEERGIKFSDVKFGTTEAKDMGMRYRIGIRGVKMLPKSLLCKYKCSKKVLMGVRLHSVISDEDYEYLRSLLEPLGDNKEISDSCWDEVRDAETMINMFITRALERPLMELGYDEEKWQKLVDEMTNETENSEAESSETKMLKNIYSGIAPTVGGFIKMVNEMVKPGAGILEKIYELGNPDNATKYEKFLESHGYEIRLLYNACFE